jgi:DNA-binding IclR family transcriptional regulator
MQAERPDPLYIAAIERAMNVLRVFGEAQTPLGVSEVARAAGLTQPTTWRICYTLQKLGYLSADRLGQLRPGLPLLALGHAALASENVQEISAPLLQDLADRYQGVAGIAVRDAHSMLYVDRHQASAAMLTMNLRVGSRVPILTSAMGWAYLASLEGGEQARTIAGLRKQHKDLPAKVLRMLDEQMRAYPQQGFIVNLEVFHPNIGFVGVPLVHPRTGETLTINCGGVLSSVSARKLQDDVGPALVKVAALLKSALGG